MDLISNPYRGPPHIPHASEDLFKIIFTGTHVAFAMIALPGRFFGTEFRPHKYSNDYLQGIGQENRAMNMARRGDVPTFSYRTPIYNDSSWPRMWYRHLQAKSWALERLGPIYSSV